MQPNERFILSMIFIVFTVINIMAGSFVIFYANEESVKIERRKSADEQQCLESLSTIANAKISSQGDDIRVVVKDIKDPKMALVDLSMASVMCLNKQVYESCIGEACIPDSKNNISMTFTLKKIY